MFSIVNRFLLTISRPQTQKIENRMVGVFPDAARRMIVLQACQDSRCFTITGRRLISGSTAMRCKP